MSLGTLNRERWCRWRLNSCAPRGFLLFSPAPSLSSSFPAPSLPFLPPPLLRPPPLWPPFGHPGLCWILMASISFELRWRSKPDDSPPAAGADILSGGPLPPKGVWSRSYRGSRYWCRWGRHFIWGTPSAKRGLESILSRIEILVQGQRTLNAVHLQSGSKLVSYKRRKFRSVEARQ